MSNTSSSVIYIRAEPFKLSNFSGPIGIRYVGQIFARDLLLFECPHEHNTPTDALKCVSVQNPVKD